MTNYYVSADAASGGDGKSWQTAFQKLPCRPERGATYWITPGVYPSVVLDTPEEGTTPITIRIADSSGQAIFRGNHYRPFVIGSPYWEIDGCSKLPSESTTKEIIRDGCGIKIQTNINQDNSNLLRLDDGAHHINICGVELAANGTETGYRQDCFNATRKDTHHITVEWCWLHDAQRTLAFLNNAHQCEFKHNLFQRRKAAKHYATGSTIHGEAVSINFCGLDAGISIHHNIFLDCGGTGVIVPKDSVQGGFEIFCNYFEHTNEAYYCTNGAITNTTGDTNHSMLVYHNTFRSINRQAGIRWRGAGQLNNQWRNQWLDCPTVNNLGTENQELLINYNELLDLNGEPFNKPISSGCFNLSQPAGPATYLADIYLESVETATMKHFRGVLMEVEE